MSGDDGLEEDEQLKDLDGVEVTNFVSPLLKRLTCFFKSSTISVRHGIAKRYFHDNY